MRYLLATEAGLVLRVCLLISLVSLVGTGFTLANPPVTEVTASTDRHTVTTSLDTEATVVRDSSLYQQGETLSNMPVYPRSVAPNTTVRVTTTPPPDEVLQVEQRITLVYEARTNDGEEFWRQTEVLQHTNASTEQGPVVSNATLDIAAIERHLGQLNADVGDAGDVTVHLDVEATYSTAHHDGSLSDQSELVLREGSYDIDSFTLNERYGPTETELRPIPSKVVRISLPLFGSLVIPHMTALFAVLGAGGLIGCAVTSAFGGNFDPAEEQLALQKARYDEWITSGALPSEFEGRTITVDSLEGLVDIAIDTSQRVIHDPPQQTYAVIGTQTTYLFSEQGDTTE